MGLMVSGNSAGYSAPGLAVYQNATTQSLLMWVYMDSASWVGSANNITFWSHGMSGTPANRYPAVEVSGATAQFRATFDHSTTAGAAIASQSLPTKTWVMLSVTYGGTGKAPKLYIGDLNTPATESANYVASTVSVGTPKTASIVPVVHGNRSDATASQGTARVIMSHMIWVPRVLSLQEIRSWQYKPYLISGAMMFCEYGTNGTTSVVDLSGYKNHAFPTQSASLGSFFQKPSCPLPPIN